MEPLHVQAPNSEEAPAAPQQPARAWSRSLGALVVASAVVVCVPMVLMSPAAFAILTGSLRNAAVTKGSFGDHGCLGPAGFTWCPSSQSCVRQRTESCPGGSEFCQAYCSKSLEEMSEQNVGHKFCRCFGEEALDYAPPVCTDLQKYDLPTLDLPFNGPSDAIEGFVVMNGRCAPVSGYAFSFFGLPVHDSSEECDTTCVQKVVLDYQTLFNLEESKWTTFEWPAKGDCVVKTISPGRLALLEVPAKQDSLRQKCHAVEGKLMQIGCSSNMALYCTRDPYHPEAGNSAVIRDSLAAFQPSFVPKPQEKPKLGPLQPRLRSPSVPHPAKPAVQRPFAGVPFAKPGAQPDADVDPELDSRDQGPERMSRRGMVTLASWAVLASRAIRPAGAESADVNSEFIGKYTQQELEGALSLGDTKFKSIPTQFIAALGEPSDSMGTGADKWGIWTVDPGPRGVMLRDWKQLDKNGGFAPAGWKFNSKDWWVEEHGLIMESPDFPLPPGKYRVTGGREVTTGLTILPDGRWQLQGGAKLRDVTHLPCRSARYKPVEADASPGNFNKRDFPVVPGGAMPGIDGYENEDYAVLFVTGIEETPASQVASVDGWGFGAAPLGDESLMKKNAFGTCPGQVQSNLRWGVGKTLANSIGCNNRVFAEFAGYWQSTELPQALKDNEKITFYDSVTGKPLFVAPQGRTMQEFIKESKFHGWPSFRDEEVVMANVRVLRDGEAVSIDGTHLGHNLPDKRNGRNRYCIDLASVAGNPVGST